MNRWRQVALAVAAALTLGTVAARPATAEPDHDRHRKAFDLQAHRGGMGLVVESTVPAFANALELGVSTLELDVQITEDRQAVVTHDRRISNRTCKDTAPAFPGDPEFPYVGKYVHTLTLAQVRTMDCGSTMMPAHPGQRAVPGEKMALLSEVFALVHRYRAYGVKLNVETKVEAGAPHETAPREQFVQVTVNEVRKARLLRQVTVQSFDWGALMRMRQVEPRLPLVALTNYDFLQTGRPGASPWLGGLDIDDFGGDPLRAVRSFGASAFSPVHGFPQNGKVTDPDYRPYVTRDMVERAHRMGLKVIPWTINDEPTMHKLIDDGVDGIITDYPDRLRDVMAERSLKPPKGYRAR
ncbi:glycerophosphodiester phosphodiesterase family protein [Thermomonospora cellulosilytica]|uniref:Glycerophosphoryl diester phosphodiesterase n=1 Tax=Thermomonospora cellulosilytica TaxID=1411118 RepID=A0A7W3N2B9_9ACTN|nr:glycerophosphodiester phosphodiesterase family protein [Thermomonospora cellulosilytica]MBA9006236.1 glycerophosphoryl diester phosphodiesterase [Thermomonospora cellulosilytica]